jgi:hypothetical protein
MFRAARTPASPQNKKALHKGNKKQKKPTEVTTAFDTQTGL